jgi:hypothetical protein
MVCWGICLFSQKSAEGRGPLRGLVHPDFFHCGAVLTWLIISGGIKVMENISQKF